MTAEANEVLVVLDPNFGERLRHASGRQPVWIVMSPANEPVIRSIWAATPNISHLTGITALTHYEDEGPEGRFLAYLDTIELHHGAMSTTTPYTVIKVIGVPLTTAVRRALSELGFAKFDQGSAGFEAIRSLEEAVRIRD
jgi:hypothetical protein